MPSAFGVKKILSLRPCWPPSAPGSTEKTRDFYGKDEAEAKVRPVAVTGPGFLDVAAWRQKESLTVHLVNLTNPMTMKGPFREFVPVGPFTVKIRLPESLRARRVQLLVAGTAPPAEEAAGALTVTVPSVTDHEVVAVDFS